MWSEYQLPYRFKDIFSEHFKLFDLGMMICICLLQLAISNLVLNLNLGHCGVTITW